jgi:hypothetical protein
MKKKIILKLQTHDWNKLSSKEQDKAILFMLRILAELSGNRKHGYDPKYWAQYP